MGKRATTTLFALVALAASFAPASAAPVCSEPPREICGGRIFPEAELTASFVQHDNGEYLAGIRALAEEFPRYVKVRNFSKLLGEETLSVGGRKIWMIEVTDFRAPEDKKESVAVSLSVHGPERAGLEGGVRYAEDLARWATGDGDVVLRNGTEDDSIAVPVRDVLKRVHLYLTDINPDGWARGDIANGGVFQRGNAAGVDLNREFPTKGWTETSHTPLSEPEAIAWDEVATGIAPDTAADLHGELTSANNAYADIMYPAGQWNPLELAREERLARHMSSNVTRYFEEQGIEAGTVTGIAGMKAAEYATAYDVVGYDDSGFMGDYFTERLGATEVDVEHFFSHQVPNSQWVAAHEDAHIAAVRAEIETLMVEAIARKDVNVSLRLGRVGYLYDPAKVTSKDGYGGPSPPEGVEPLPYKVSRMRYFRDLSRYSKRRLTSVDVNQVRARTLASLDTFVVSGGPFPRDRKGRPAPKKRVVRALKGFVEGGGNLVLTDRALKLLPRLGIVPTAAVTKQIHNAGHIDIEEPEDRYLKKVHTTASQTYYEVPLGYSVAQDSSPHYVVERAAWEEAGGESIAYITSEDEIGLGRVKVKKGTVGIFGAVLPDPTEKFDHFFGLADYAVTVAGGQILNNMIALGR